VSSSKTVQAQEEERSTTKAGWSKAAST